MKWKTVLTAIIKDEAPYLASMNNVLFYVTKSFGNYLKDEQVIKPNTDYQFLQSCGGVLPAPAGAKNLDKSAMFGSHCAELVDIFSAG